MIPPALGTFGNMGRNTFPDSGFHNVDFSLAKNWHFGEHFRAQFRAEFFNILNHTNFAPPTINHLESISATGTPQSGFGVLTNTQVPNREIQFALKMIW